MTDAEIKEKINNKTRRMSLPDAKIVYVRHCNEQVPVGDKNPSGGICHLIHPDVTINEFFA